MGPASKTEPMLKRLAEAGMNMTRINFAHGDMEEHLTTIRTIRAVSEQLTTPIPVLLDIKGPEIRTGKLAEPSVQLVEGAALVLTTEELEGTAAKVSITHKKLPLEVRKDSVILLDDGLIELKVVSTTDTEITCTIVNGGILKSRKGVNVPGVQTSLPGVTEKDKEQILFGIKHKIDYIAMSFVRQAADVNEVRAMLKEHGASSIQIISKIENQEGVDNFDAILAASDGIMVARGDLGVEVPVEEVPLLQKMMIRKCNAAGKLVITATHMLESMQQQPRPTRAEASDVANAVLDGTDVLMLSGESAIGKYPVQSVTIMGRIAERMEQALRTDNSLVTA
jgi:pyruvate kinase